MEFSLRRWLRRGLADAATTAIAQAPAASAAAVIQARAGARPRLLALRVEKQAGNRPDAPALRALLHALPHRESRVCSVMQAGSYQLLQLDAVNVPDAELRQAMRWQLKDLVAVAPEKLALDVFHAPPRPNANAARQVYVVAAEQAQIDAQADAVTAADRQLAVIDIPELALRNVMALIPGESGGCAMLMLGRGFVQILISRQQCLYVTRRLDGSVIHDPDQIGLEVQRSLQYYETHFDSAPISQVWIAPGGAQAESLAPQLAAATGLQVQVLRLAELLDCDGSLADESCPEALLAVGAALRPAARQVLQ